MFKRFYPLSVSTLFLSNKWEVVSQKEIFCSSTNLVYEILISLYLSTPMPTNILMATTNLGIPMFPKVC